MSAHTPGPWKYACDSYGKVQHSKKACVFATVKDARGFESSPHVASRIDNWEDAKLIAASPDLLAAARDAQAAIASNDSQRELALRQAKERLDAAIAKVWGGA